MTQNKILVGILILGSFVAGAFFSGLLLTRSINNSGMQKCIYPMIDDQYDEGVFKVIEDTE